MINVAHIVNGVVFAVLGLVILGLGLLLFDKLTPGSFWKEICDEHNSALGILVAGMAIAMSIIVAAAMG